MALLDLNQQFKLKLKLKPAVFAAYTLSTMQDCLS